MKPGHVPVNGSTMGSKYSSLNEIVAKIQNPTINTKYLQDNPMHIVTI